MCENYSQLAVSAGCIMNLLNTKIMQFLVDLEHLLIKIVLSPFCKR